MKGILLMFTTALGFTAVNLQLLEFTVALFTDFTGGLLYLLLFFPVVFGSVGLSIYGFITLSARLNESETTPDGAAE